MRALVRRTGENTPAVNIANCSFVTLEIFTPGAPSYGQEGGIDLPPFFPLHSSRNFFSWEESQEKTQQMPQASQVRLEILQGRCVGGWMGRTCPSALRPPAQCHVDWTLTAAFPGRVQPRNNNLVHPCNELTATTKNARATNV